MSANIPNPFGGFAPFPNSIMIPFMGAQSAVLGYEFGLAYEMGKRTVKAMPNDLFNKLVAGSADEINVVYDGQEYNMKYSDYIDFLVKKFHSSKIDEFREHLPTYIELQNTLIDKTVEIEVAKANRTPSAFREIFEGFTAGFTEQQKNDFGNFLQGLSDGFSKFLSFFGVNTTTTTDPTELPLWYNPRDTTTTGNNWDTLKAFSLQIQDPIAGFTRSYHTCEMSFEGHVAQYNLIYENVGVASTDCQGNSFSGTAMSHVVGKYKDAINFFYYNNP